MRRLAILFCWVTVIGMIAGTARAGTYTLTDGKEYVGEPITIKDDGIKLKTGPDSYTPRITWDKLTQDALKTLLSEAKSPNERAIIEPLIEEPAPPKAAPKEIKVKPVQMPPRPTENIGLLAIFSSPLGLLIFMILYAATIFAGYEVAIYRDQPIGLVCGFAAVPFVGVASPIAFFFIKPRAPSLPEMDYPGTPAPVASESTAPTTTELAAPLAPVETPKGKTSSVATPGRSSKLIDPTAPRLPEPIVFRRGDFSFNRRFFETKLANFQKLVPSPAEKDLVVWIKAVRGEYTGRRITQINAADLHLQVFKADATADEMIPFVEILEVQIRHKDLVV